MACLFGTFHFDSSLYAVLACLFGTFHFDNMDSVLRGSR